MNGRVYDPVLGRFLSADPNVDGVEDAQGYNRYSYVGNNPLGATDPTGFLKLKDVLPALIAIVVTVATYGAASTWATAYLYANTSMFMSTAITAGSIAGGAITGAAAGFASGFAGSLLNGGGVGDAFKAGAVGGAIGIASGALTAGIGARFGPVSNSWATEGGRAFAHGAVGGAIEEAIGGEFRHGFYAGAIGSAAGSLAPHLGLPEYSNQSGSAVASRTIVAAVAGGTAAAVGGGKFINGALTSAFQHLLNAEGRHDPVRDKAESTALKGKEKILRVVMIPDDAMAKDYKNWMNDSGYLSTEFDGGITIIDHYSSYDELKARVELYRELAPGSAKLIIMGHGELSRFVFDGKGFPDTSVYSDLSALGWQKAQTTLAHCHGIGGMFPNTSFKAMNAYRESVGSSYRWKERPDGNFEFRKK